MNFKIKINGLIEDKEVPSLRESIGWTRRDTDYPVLFERCNFWCSVRNDENMLMGFGYVCGMGLEHGYIEDIMIHPDFQNQGIGKALLAALINESARRDIEILTLTFSEDKREFYESCNFGICLGGVICLRDFD